MKKFFLHQSVPHMEVHVPRYDGALTAKQIHEPFEVEGKGKGKPGDYLVCCEDELSIMKKEEFEAKWQKM